ncbi:MAG TPA: radical SAM protein [Candidatus Acidoferrales bacterium]|nr:radical SAM protein [Candidatus Acidoferrales bacterium]
MNSHSGLVTLTHDTSPEAHRITTLPVLVFHAHTSCNCRCLMCDIWRTAEHRSLRPEEMERHLESMRQLGVKWIVFTGGEPLLNPDLAAVCALLRPLGIRLTLLTTGLLLKKYSADVANSFDEIILSLDGPESIHNSIRRVDNAFALIKTGVAAVKELKPALRITARTTVQRSNCFYLRESVAAAKELKLDGISFLAADVQSEAFNRPLVWPAERQNEVALSHSDLPALEAEIQGLIRDCEADIQLGYIAESPIKLYRILAHFRAHLGIEPARAPICNAPWTSAVIETDGTVRPCFFHPPVGNIRQMSLEEVVNSNKAVQFRSSLDIESNEICRRCVCSLNYRS